MILLMPSNWQPSQRHLARLQEILGRPDAVAVVDDESRLAQLAADARIVFGHRYLRQTLPLARSLAWVQSTAAGIEHLPCQELRERGIVLTRNPENSQAIALHALALLLALVRRLPDHLLDQSQGRWGGSHSPLREPKTVLLLGLGAIAAALAPRLRALGMTVLGSARSGSPAQRALCDQFVAWDAWRDALPGIDALILALPETPQTRGLIDRATLVRLRPGALLVNVARAGLVDLDALTELLHQGQLAGAALDLIDPVPPPTAALWHTPRLLITPKRAAYHPDMQDRFERFAEANLERFLAGLPLAARVDLGSSP